MSEINQDTSPLSRRISRRNFLKLAGATAATLALDKPLARRAEASQEERKPGGKAPESWGGAGILDVVTAYVVDPEFKGQAVILLRHDEQFALTIVDGRKKDGTIVKGYSTRQGFEVQSKTDELNISLGGNGGAFLRYDREAKTLTFSLMGFPVGSSDNPEERITFETGVHVDPDRSRILHGYTPSYLQNYMRAGSKESGGSDTQSLMVAHASLRNIPNTHIEQQATSINPSFWTPLLPTVAVSPNGKSLYVVQNDSTRPGNLTAFAWKGGRHDMEAETDVTIRYDSDESDEHAYPVPKRLDISFHDKNPRTIIAKIAQTDRFGFPVEFPNPITGGTVKADISLPILKANIGGRDLWMMTQTVALPPTQNNK